MALISEKDVEKRLSQAGKKLEHPPQSKNELLSILEEVENCLSMVEQSPSETMQLAVAPSVTSLVKPELLRHQDKDVRLVVITCISEITRITAPEAPYSDDTMREIFQLIVGSFQGLDEIKSPSFARRVTILETVAKVRSCVVMLDLECDDLILEMFRHFFATASKNHSENVVASMQTIMILVLDESEDISQQLLSVLLTSLRKNEREVSPAAHTLAINVVKRCAEKLKPYLTAEMSAEGLTPSDLQKKYHEIVYEICQHESHTSSVPVVLNNAEHLLVDGTHATASVVGNDSPLNTQAANMDPVVKFADDEDLRKSEDKHKPAGDENGHKELPQKISENSIKDEGKENVSQDILSPATNKASKGRRSVQSRRPTSTIKIEPDKPLDSKVLESSKPTVEVKEGRKGRKSEVLPEVTKVSDESVVASDTQALPSSKRKRGRSDKNNKNLASLAQETKEIGELKSTSQSIVELGDLASTDQPNENMAGLALLDQLCEDTVGLTSREQANKETVGLAATEAQPIEDKIGGSPTQSNKEATILASPGQSSKEAVGVACPAPLNIEIEGLTSAAESTKVADNLISPPRSNKDTEGLTSPARSIKDNISSPSRTGSTKETVTLASPARSSKETAGLTSPNEKQSLPEDDDTGTDSSRVKRGRLRSAGKRSAMKEDSKSPGLSVGATERASEIVAGGEMAPSALPNTNEKSEISKDSETRSKRSKRKLDVNNFNTAKSEEAISLRKKGSKEMDTPDATQEDSHRPKKMQKVASTTESAEKDLSQATESSKRTPRNSAKKRSISVLEKTPDTVERNGLDDNLVGRKIKVWWPKDKQFYDGTVDSYDSKQNKHKIIYNDGDVEILNLQRQKWDFIDDIHTTEKSSKVDASPKMAGEKSPKKKANKVEGPVVKGETPKSSAKRGSQSSKSKKEYRSRADDNGAVTDMIVSKENVDQPTIGGKGRQQKQGGQSKKSKQVASASTPTNGSGRKSKGTKEVKNITDQDQIGISSDTGARSSDDEPLNAWRSRARTE